MARLYFDARGWAFHVAVRHLMMSFNSSSSALAAERQQVAHELAEYVRKVAAGEPIIGDWEDGVLLWDRGRDLEMQIEMLDEAAMALRKAFALSIYHQWERSAQGWIFDADKPDQKPPRNHEDLAKAVAGKGFPSPNTSAVSSPSRGYVREAQRSLLSLTRRACR